MHFLLICLVGLLVCAPASPVSPPVVSGQVRLADGSPVAGAQVVLFDVGDLGRGPVGQATTDEAGQFALSLTAASAALALPQGFALGANYPNPFNPSTIIPYQLAATSPVRLEVFNILGQHMATLVDGEQAAGSYRARWDGTDAAGGAAASGVYFYRLTVAGAQQTGKMVLTDGQAGVPLGGPSVAAVPLASGSTGSYGLVVSGAGLVAYVDADFGGAVGPGPVALVVEPQPQARGKIGPVDSVVEPQPLLDGLLGDVNNSGHVDLDDGLLVAMHRVDPALSLPNHGSIGLGDVDCNGRVERADVELLATYVVHPSDPTVSSLRIGQRGGYSLGPVTDMVWGSILGTAQQDATVARLLDEVPVLISGVLPIDGRDHLYLGIDRAYYQHYGGEQLYNALKERFPITPLFVEASDGVQQPERRPQPEPVPPLPAGIGAGKAHSSDQAVLVALYEATDGDTWTNNSHWLSEKPLEEWFGVATDENGRVTRLNLRSNGLRGSLPPALGQLHNLTYLNLRSNGLRGSIPQSLGQLQNLEKLYLYDNQLSGSIPQSLGQLQNLEVLNLRSNGLRGSLPPALGQLQNLTYLNLRGNGLRGSLPPALGQLHNLTHLNLRDNQLSGSLPASLVNLTHLEWLVVDSPLCVPTDAGFQAWLEGIENKRGVVHCTGDGSDSATADATPEDEPTTRPDLVLSFSVSPNSLESGGSITIQVTVQNDGTADAGSESIIVYRHRNRTSNPTSGGSRLTTTATTGTLTAGEQVTRTVTATTPSVTADTTYYYYVCVAAADGEVVTGDNCTGPAEVRVRKSLVTRDIVGGDTMIAIENSEDQFAGSGSITLGGLETADGTRGFVGSAHVVAADKTLQETITYIQNDAIFVGNSLTYREEKFKIEYLLGRVTRLPHQVRTEGGRRIFGADAAFIAYPHPQTPGCSVTWNEDSETFCLETGRSDEYIERVKPLVVRGENDDVYTITGSQRPTKGLTVSLYGDSGGYHENLKIISTEPLLTRLTEARDSFSYSYFAEGHASISGDSGGPVYTTPDTNGNTKIVGVIEGHTIADGVAYTSFSSWDDVMEALDLKPISP